MRPTAIGPVMVALGAVLLVVSFTQPWTSAGLASSLSGGTLADLLLRGTVGRFAPRWAGIGLYLVPICGGLVLLGVGLGGAGGRRLSVGALGVASVAGLLIAGSLGWRPMSDPSPAAVLVTGGVALGVLGLVAEHRQAGAARPGRGEGRPPQR